MTYSVVFLLRLAFVLLSGCESTNTTPGCLGLNWPQKQSLGIYLFLWRHANLSFLSCSMLTQSCICYSPPTSHSLLPPPPPSSLPPSTLPPSPSLPKYLLITMFCGIQYDSCKYWWSVNLAKLTIKILAKFKFGSGFSGPFIKERSYLSIEVLE